MSYTCRSVPSVKKGIDLTAFGRTMKKKLRALAASTWLALYALTGVAVAQTAASSAQNGGIASRNADAKSMMKKADSDYKAAKAACKPMKRVEAKTCLQDAKAAYQQAKVEARGMTRDANVGGATVTPSSLPAVETQSPAVSATGIAPRAVGPNLTPGKPAVPGK